MLGGGPGDPEEDVLDDSLPVSLFIAPGVCECHLGEGSDALKKNDNMT